MASGADHEIDRVCPNRRVKSVKPCERMCSRKGCGAIPSARERIARQHAHCAGSPQSGAHGCAEGVESGQHRRFPHPRSQSRERRAARGWWQSEAKALDAPYPCIGLMRTSLRALHPARGRADLCKDTRTEASRAHLCSRGGQAKGRPHMRQRSGRHGRHSRRSSDGWRRAAAPPHSNTTHPHRRARWHARVLLPQVISASTFALAPSETGHPAPHPLLSCSLAWPCAVAALRAPAESRESHASAGKAPGCALCASHMQRQDGPRNAKMDLAHRPA